jgi:hypothetical protein
MKLLLLKPLGKLVAGETHYTRSDEQGQGLIDSGVAELHPELDPEPTEIKRVLYQDPADNGWKVKEVPVTELESAPVAPVVVDPLPTPLVPAADLSLDTEAPVAPVDELIAPVAPLAPVVPVEVKPKK